MNTAIGIIILTLLVLRGIHFFKNHPTGLKRRIDFSIFGILLFLFAANITYADPYESRPHEWKDHQRFRKAVTFYDTVTIPDGGISAGEIANTTREIYFPMAGWAIDGGADIDEATAPEIGAADNIPAIIWDNSGETGAIQQTFRLPATYVSGLTIYCMVSSDTASGATTGIDWGLWVNGNDVTFDATRVEQTGATCTSATLDASHEVLTLTMDATGEAAVSAGSLITIDIFNATTHASANLELKGVHGTYAATQ